MGGRRIDGMGCAVQGVFDEMRLIELSIIAKGLALNVSEGETSFCERGFLRRLI